MAKPNLTSVVPEAVLSFPPVIKDIRLELSPKAVDYTFGEKQSGRSKRVGLPVSPGMPLLDYEAGTYGCGHPAERQLISVMARHQERTI